MIDDLYFERELKERIKERLIRRSKRTNRIYDEEYSNPYNPNYESEYDFMGCEKISEITEEVFQDFDSAIERYYFINSDKEDDETNYYEKYSIPFKEKFTDKNLFEEFNKRDLTEEEDTYLKLQTYKGDVVNTEYFVKKAFVQIILRRKILEEFSQEQIEGMLDVMKKDNRYAFFSKLLSDKPFGENVAKEYEELIENDTIKDYDRAINCGGYALRIDVPIFPPIVETQYEAVSKILNEYDFVRLLGEKQLEDDEYLVFYKWYRNKDGIGHHFIRVDSDGTVREKNSVDKAKNFSDWADIYKDSKQTAFAVKKEHKMFGYSFMENKKNEILNFEDAAEKSIDEHNNTFSYHDREYHFKKNENGKAIIITNDNKIVGEAIIEEDDRIVDVIDGQKDYVENILGFVNPIIKNGKLVNFDEFKKQKTNDDKDNNEIEL